MSDKIKAAQQQEPNPSSGGAYELDPKTGKRIRVEEPTKPPEHPSTKKPADKPGEPK